MKKTLLETNPYLKDAAKRTRALARNVETSSAIEGIWVKRDEKNGRFISEKKSVSPPAKATKTSR